MTTEQQPHQLPAKKASRVWIEDVKPQVDCGLFPIKRIVGEKVKVSAYIFTDGHDRPAAVLCCRDYQGRWFELPMSYYQDDVWLAEFQVEQLGTHAYTIKAWIDHFSTWQSDLLKKFKAGQHISSELLEGAAMIDKAAGRADSPDRQWLEAASEALRGDISPELLVDRATAEDLNVMMKRYPDRTRETVFEPLLTVTVESEAARYGAWYELFPRSITPDPSRSGTFRDVEKVLPEIAGLGFTVLYLPPIHPIGHTKRKGRNNSLVAGKNDPGSPWAIGSEAGGHKAVHPELGTLEDFEHLVEAARSHGLAIALDMAFQCSPDHPYVHEHPEWFRHRPDGSIKFAENPPKKYEDIYPLNFDCDEWQSLWQELKSVVLFWAERGVCIFRVDNPHTKPFYFWEWLIREVRSAHPETVFLSEAFTRPRVMYALAKAGFSQSYTYFTWRNTKEQLTTYLSELIDTEIFEYFRPNFFVNTPDILPEYLQFGGRSAFMIRVVLAATLSASYGIYSGFELLENEAAPDSEEYLYSEKYEIKPRDWNKKGNLRPFIARINQIRQENPALAMNKRLQFYPVHNDHLLFYGKTTEDMSNIILVAVNLDPYNTHDGWLEVPLEKFGINENEVFQVHELLGDSRYLWEGRNNYVRLDPASSPAQIFRIRRRVRSEHDFDYFI